MKKNKTILFFAILLLAFFSKASITGSPSTKLQAFPQDYEKKRVLISTDIGGGDPDDIQSMIHFLLYSDMFDVEGIVGSQPYPDGPWWRKILRAYRTDYKHMKFHSDGYLTPRQLKRKHRIGSKINFTKSKSSRSSGSKLIIKAAMSKDPRPLHILIWGGATDVAQALYDRPKIAKKIRIVAIGGWNRKQDPGAFSFVEQMQKTHKFPMVAADRGDTGRGIYLTGLRGTDPYGNVGFVRKFVRKHGASGRLFHRASEHIDVNRWGIKMGDTPTVFYIMNGSFDFKNKKITDPSWGGRYCKISKNYYGDCLSIKKWYIGHYSGAKTISVHRKKYLNHWKNRMKRLVALPN